MVKGIFRNWLGITELQESQKIDAEKFEKVFGELKNGKKLKILMLNSLKRYLVH